MRCYPMADSQLILELMFWLFSYGATFLPDASGKITANTSNNSVARFGVPRYRGTCKIYQGNTAKISRK